ncbi:MAG: phosphoribosylformylglycinamidine synthase [Treponema sp.]|jgi:phosphoribosylformylglycinamidine synthase|nr:phosphoribosylformylglycinamidine synthase [Treponema sp.]
MEVRRVYVEKREGFNIEARRLQSELAEFLGTRHPCLARLKRLRILNRYDAASLSEEQFRRITASVFSEPQCDRIFFGEAVPAEARLRYFAAEYLPGQYDQRSDSAEQCAELAAGTRPRIRCARVYVLEDGEPPVSEEAFEAVKRYLINPVDSREASLRLPPNLEEKENVPGDLPLISGFGTITARNTAGGARQEAAELADIIRRYGLAMSIEDLAFCKKYFSALGRDPGLAEFRVLDTYWSDHCRHTTFNTVLENIEIAAGPLAPALAKALSLYESARREVYGAAAEQRPRTLMDMATIGAKLLKKRNLAGDVEESKEINACTIKVDAEFDDGTKEPWLLLFKNETHNHPTEIEPFGGAATCLGGAIRDPLSGRAYVYQAMRITGGGDPRQNLDQTLPGKLPQIKIAHEAAAGYSSYGNQIGLATGQVAEFYHPGFLAKRLELGAVIAAAPAASVRREEPVPGDVVILAGGKTGRDGIGGATGSSKVHTGESVQTAGAEVQKGNAVEERKLQRLFRRPEAARLIKRCNDFGAGGVSVAVGELAAGIDIDLDKVPKKYAGLDGIELAISESQERMALVTAAGDAEAFISAAAAENLDAVIIAKITAGGNAAKTRGTGEGGAFLRMRWRGKTIVELSRAFLDSNGAPRSASALLPAAPRSVPAGSLLDGLEQELGSLRSGSRRGLQERFDGSIGAAAVLFPWGGKEQGTPECGMAALLPSPEKQCRTASLMSFGFNPDLMERNPYEGAKGSVREALAKFACLGGNPRQARLSLQEYFERPQSPETWGSPAAALLGALEAQIELGVPAVGGKDSMSGNYQDPARGLNLSVPPTLVAFAAGCAPASSVRSGALSGGAGNVVILLSQEAGRAGAADNADSPAAAGSIAHNESVSSEWDIFRANMDALAALGAAGLARSAYPVGPGGTAASLAVMAFGNSAGLELYEGAFSLADNPCYQGSVLVEIDGKNFGKNPEIKKILERAGSWEIAARCIAEPVFRVNGGVKTAAEEKGGQETAELPLETLRRAYEYPLSRVYPQTSAGADAAETSAVKTPTAELSPAAGKSLPAGAALPSGAGPRRKRKAGDSGRASPLVILPVFPGTNCEGDMERAFRGAGARTRQMVFKNRNREEAAASIRELASAIGGAQILALSGGFSAGDEPEGSGKFMANVFRAPAVAEAVAEFLEKRDGLILGICNGFQALIKLGLVPCGSYREAAAGSPTLTFNRIGRHVSRMVRTRVMSTLSPWLALEEPGNIHILPVSHGEGRLVIRKEEGEELFRKGQIPFCYVDAAGRPADCEPDNPNGSDFSIEALTSPDGRILGKMAHSERRGEFVHINIPGNKRQSLFEAGVRYFQ